MRKRTIYIQNSAMAYNFFINKNSTLPYLRMEVINNGRDDFHKLYTALQSATVYFSMSDIDSGIKRIVNAEANVIEREENDEECEEEYLIEYQWKERDTKIPGIYKGWFKIVFDGNITTSDGETYPEGNLIVPISDELLIHVNDGSVKKR